MKYTLLLRIVRKTLFLLCLTHITPLLNAQELWHNKEREIHYKPDGEDFVKVNGTMRFNRALYGTNTAFRAEAGDLPEFALYMPGMGGNLKFGLISGDSSRWLINANNISTRYRPGSMIYDIKDNLLSNGTLRVTVIPLANAEGIIVKAEGTNIPANVKLFTAFGGATGTKFSRDGDIGADPESSFYLKPEYCTGNIFNVTDKKTFTLFYGNKKALSEEERYEIQHLSADKKDTTASSNAFKKLEGIFPPSAQIKIADASQQQSPLIFAASKESATPALTSQVALTSTPLYFLILNSTDNSNASYTMLEAMFNEAEAARKKLAERINIHTPDPYINTLGGALAMAADAIWEDPSYLHGSVAWRMRLNAWRGAYAADVLGWHDRARKHFSSYALSQLTTPATGPVVSDTALNLARQLEKLGTSLFSSGYVSRNPGGDKRPHHYDMNLVFFDQLLNHFYWTGDKDYIKQMWPTLQRHLAWEKRNFDVDGDGLYDAYASIWASDALQYSGGGVTHSSAYNYRSNKVAAQLAAVIGENGAPYEKEANKILNAINSKLWIKELGSYAEYKDLLGLKKIHPSAGLWTIYHAIDSKINDPFQGYQALRYVDNDIPKIPIRAKGLTDTSLYTISTTNWQPYTWSINNVALAEVHHTALAYWQAKRSEEAYRLWKSALIESMYVGASPGNIQQLSFYDAIRGELYRDFADPVGMTARTLIEGLFGINPDALKDTLHITPGFPAEWDHASITTPDLNYSFSRANNTDAYTFTALAGKSMKLSFIVKAKSDDVKKVTVNGKPATWKVVTNSIGTPSIEITYPSSDKYTVVITWSGRSFEKATYPASIAKGEELSITQKIASFQNVFDPQNVLNNIKSDPKKVSGIVRNTLGNKTFFVKLKQGQFIWWQPLDIKVIEPFEVIALHEENSSNHNVAVRNNTAKSLNGKLTINGSATNIDFNVAPEQLVNIKLPAQNLMAGSNRLAIATTAGKLLYEETLTNWSINNATTNNYERVDLSKHFNDEVSNIFKNQYLSPRPAVPTLQLPTQGIGNWCYPLTMANISDTGLRVRAGDKNEIIIGQGVPFATPSQFQKKNIIYTSLWNNYPDSVKVPLLGRASHAYFLMAGSTNPMQSRFTNGVITIRYKDGSNDKLELKNPETWWPIEQDYYVDGYAFTTDAPKPVRVYLKTGEDTRDFKKFVTIKGFSNMGIDGGAATVLDLPLNNKKELKEITVRTLANDVVIGLMSLTLVR